MGWCRAMLRRRQLASDDGSLKLIRTQSYQIGNDHTVVHWTNNTRSLLLDSDRGMTNTASRIAIQMKANPVMDPFPCDGPVLVLVPVPVPVPVPVAGQGSRPARLVSYF